MSCHSPPSFDCDHCTAAAALHLETTLFAVRRLERGPLKQKLTEHYQSDVAAALIDKVVNSTAQIQLDGTAYTHAIYYAETNARSAPDGVPLAECAAGLPTAVATAVADRARNGQNNVHVYRAPDGTVMARPTTPLNATDCRTLAKAVRKRGIKGVQLDTVYKEYRTAHADLESSPQLWVSHNRVWHTSVATPNSPKVTALYNRLDPII